jgi:hypothetical protein
MKKLLLVFLLLFFQKNLFSQLFVAPETENIQYMGKMTQEVLSILDSRERKMYEDCLEMIQQKHDSVVWLEGDYLQKVFENSDKYRFQLALRDSKNDRYKNVMVGEENESRLPVPMCLVFLKRYQGSFKISIQKYF